MAISNAPIQHPIPMFEKMLSFQASRPWVQWFGSVRSSIETLQTHVEGIYNVKNYGAVGDGVTDERAAFQAAIDAANTAGGGTVFIPPGTFRFTTFASGTTILTPKANVRIVGSGPSTILTVAASFTDWDFFRTDADTDNLVFKNFIYDGNGINNLVGPATTRLHNLFYLQYGNKLTVRNVICQNVAGQRCMTIGAAGVSSGYTDVLVEECHFETVADAVTGNTDQTDHSSIWCNANRSRIVNNVFTNGDQSTVATAIECHGQGNVVAWNSINKYNLGIIAAAIYDAHTESVYPDNVMTSVRSGYRTYAQSDKDFDIQILGGSISQVGEAYPVIDLDYFTTLARRVVVDGVLLRNTEASPSGDNPFGIAVGRCDSVIIKNVCMQDIASRGIALGLNIGISTDETRLIIQNVTMIDGGRTSEAATYATGVCIFETDTLVYLEVSGCRFINTSGTTPMLKGITGNAPVTNGSIFNNSFVGIDTPNDYSQLIAAAKQGFYGTTPIVQAILATGAGATVDDVITALQNLGMVKQA